MVKEVETVADLEGVVATAGGLDALEIVEAAGEVVGGVVGKGESVAVVGEWTIAESVVVDSGGSERSGRGRFQLILWGVELRSSRSAWSSLKWSISRRERRRFWQR